MSEGEYEDTERAEMRRLERLKRSEVEAMHGMVEQQKALVEEQKKAASLISFPKQAFLLLPALIAAHPTTPPDALAAFACEYVDALGREVVKRYGLEAPRHE